MLTDKSALRAHFKQQRAQMPLEKQVERDAEIMSRLLVTEAYRHCTAVYTYVSKRGEINTEPLIQAAWANGKRVAVPRCDTQGTMQFYWITDWAQLRDGAFGLREPDSNCLPASEPTDKAICIVPGLCFDAEGYRVGYGRGYYDRFLPSFAGTVIGLCPISAMLLRVPRESTDQAVHMIITERYTRTELGRKEDKK